MLTDLTPFSGAIGAVIGACLALAGVLVNSWFTWRHQLQADAIKDARALRDVKRERLRQAYGGVLLAALAAQRVATELPVALGSPRFEVLSAQLSKRHNRAVLDVDRAHAQLLMEPEAPASVLNAFDLVRDANRQFWYLLLDDPRSLAEQAEDIPVAQEKLEAGVTALRRTIQESLSPLEEPIRDVPGLN